MLRKGLEGYYDSWLCESSSPAYEVFLADADDLEATERAMMRNMYNTYLRVEDDLQFEFSLEQLSGVVGTLRLHFLAESDPHMNPDSGIDVEILVGDKWSDKVTNFHPVRAVELLTGEKKGVFIDFSLPALPSKVKENGVFQVNFTVVGISASKIKWSGVEFIH